MEKLDAIRAASDIQKYCRMQEDCKACMFYDGINNEPCHILAIKVPQKPPLSDVIHHPDHYTWKGAECKDIIKTMTAGLEGFEAYCMGNIIKYLYRYPKKGALLQDIRKAEEYISMLKKDVEK